MCPHPKLNLKKVDSLSLSHTVSRNMHITRKNLSSSVTNPNIDYHHQKGTNSYHKTFVLSLKEKHANGTGM
jgi:hypothetical protein